MNFLGIAAPHLILWRTHQIVMWIIVSHRAAWYYWAMLLTVDTGGTKTLVAGFDRDGKPSDEYRFETPKDPDEYISTLSSAIQTHFPNRGFDGMVIALPGMIRDNIAVWCDNLGWSNVDIATFIKPVVSCPVWIENDANLAGLAETRSLSHIPPLSLYVTVSTGIGTGVITNGQIDPELSMSEGGRIMLEYKGHLEEWEEFASGRSIVKTYGKFARDIHDKKTWNEIADKISRGFLTLIPTLQPTVIIIGGSVGTYFDQYAPRLKELLKLHLPSHVKVPEIRQAAHPEEAVLYGCYYYGKDQLA